MSGYGLMDGNSEDDLSDTAGEDTEYSDDDDFEYDDDDTEETQSMKFLHFRIAYR